MKMLRDISPAFGVAALTMFGIVGCSPPNTPPAATSVVRTTADKQPSVAELLKLYDASSLVESKTLKVLPRDLQLVLGVDSTGYDRIADVAEPCFPTDVVSAGYPTKCFFVGGVSPTSALVAYKVGGYEGQSGVGAAYVRTNSGWTKVATWKIGYPSNLKELQEMTRLPPDNMSFSR